MKCFSGEFKDDGEKNTIDINLKAELIANRGVRCQSVQVGVSLLLILCAALLTACSLPLQDYICHIQHTEESKDVKQKVKYGWILTHP